MNANDARLLSRALTMPSFDSMVEDVSSIGLIMPLYNEALNQQI